MRDVRHRQRDARLAPRRQRGLTLIELLVGSAIGLIVVAAASSLVVRQIREHRALRVDARVTQELRHAADAVARDLRRAGYWAAAASSVRELDSASLTMPAHQNPYAFAPALAASDAIAFAFSRDAIENDAVDANERFGFRLRSGAVELQLGTGNWQALTDPAVVIVTAFEIAPRIEETSLAAFCAEPCTAGSTVCPPRQRVVDLDVTLAGRAAHDAAVTRVATSRVRLRHAPVVGSCEG